MKVPTQCALWKDPDATVAKGLRSQFALLDTVVKESHWWRYLLKCRGCGQLYVYEFTEEIDWADGDDPQFVTWVPVENEAEIAAVTRAPRGGLGGFVPRLCKDWLKGQPAPALRWVTAAGT